MPTWQPDPTFYPSPRMAMKAPPETLAYVAVIDPDGGRPTRWRCWTSSPDPRLPTLRSSAGRDALCRRRAAPLRLERVQLRLCPYAPHPHVERRYLFVPGLRSSRIHVVDTKPDPRQPRIVKMIEPEEVAEKQAIAARTPSTVAPTASTSTPSARPTASGPGGIFLLDHETFEVAAAGRPTAGRSTWPTTSGGTSATTP